MRGFTSPRKLASNLGVLALLSAWFITFGPVAFGGPAAYIEVSGHSMDGTYLTGDLVITRKQDSYAKGDIVAFEAGGGQVIHRIIGGNGTKGYELQGDNNADPDPWFPTDDEVVGKAWIHLPQKAWILHLPRNPMFAGVTAGMLTLLVLVWDAKPARRKREEQDSEPAADGPVEVPVQRPAHHESPALPRAR
jgi:signal peptidase